MSDYQKKKCGFTLQHYYGIAGGGTLLAVGLFLSTYVTGCVNQKSCDDYPAWKNVAGQALYEYRTLGIGLCVISGILITAVVINALNTSDGE